MRNKAEGDPEVLGQALPGAPAPQLGAVFEEHGAVAELAMSGVRGVGDALIAEFARAELEVQAHLLFEVAGEAISPKQVCHAPPVFT